VTNKVIFSYPKGTNFSAMWGQISGMADCCGAGVIGRLAGVEQKINDLYESDAPTITEPYKKFGSMRDYIMKELPRNRLFAGPPEWLHWAIVEDLLSKKQSGVHTPQIKAETVDMHKFDFEGNQYHKFWAGPSYKVEMWFITDRDGKYMSHHESICCSAFLEFLRKNQLGDIWKSGAIPGAYGQQKLWGAVYHPAYTRIEERLTKQISEVNAELQKRWNKVAPYVQNVKPVKDKVAKQW